MPEMGLASFKSGPLLQVLPLSLVNSKCFLSFINCLAEQSDIRLFVLSNKKRTATKFSRYTDYYKFYPKADDASWVNIINKEIRNMEKEELI